MPPQGKLPPEIVADFEKWISSGAATARGHGPGEHDRPVEGRKHWSFQPVVAPPVPEVKDESWPSPDRSIHSRGAGSEGAAPAPDAKPHDLRRRLHYDLTGLPPDPTAGFSKERIGRADVDGLLGDRLRVARKPAVRRAVGPALAGHRRLQRVDRRRAEHAAAGEFSVPQLCDRRVQRRQAIRPIPARAESPGDLMPAAEADAQRDEQLIATGFLSIGTKTRSTKTMAYVI